VKSLEGTAPPIPRAYGNLRESRQDATGPGIGGFLNRGGAKAPLDVLLHTAQWCKAQAQEAVLFGEWERGRVEGRGVREGVADEVEQGDDGANEVKLNNSSP